MNSKTKSFLQTLKQDDLKNDVPSVSETVGQFLCDQVEALKATSILELGTAHGYSTIWMASALEKYNGHLHTIDVSAPSFKIATENIKEAGFDQMVTQHFGNAKDIVPTIDATFDLIFIDARKRDTHIFFELCAPKLRPGGIILVDDVEKFKDKMQAFWDFIESQNEWVYQTLPLDADDSVMVASKKEFKIQQYPNSSTTS